MMVTIEPKIVFESFVSEYTASHFLDAIIGDILLKCIN